jgi:hypothetical protein
LGVKIGGRFGVGGIGEGGRGSGRRGLSRLDSDGVLSSVSDFFSGLEKQQPILLLADKRFYRVSTQSDEASFETDLIGTLLREPV